MNYNLIRKLISDITGIPLNRILKPYQDSPRPNGQFVTINVIGQRYGGETLTTDGVISKRIMATVSINLYDGNPSIINKIMMIKDISHYREQLKADNMMFYSSSSVRDLTDLDMGQYKARHQADFTVSYYEQIEFDYDESNGIEGVEIE
jgi:hypothetical protein